jgi:dTDP-4-amino-4,6-dideoxygalactose transaminase
MIPMTNPKALINKKKIFKTLKKVIKSNNYILGKEVKSFEKKFAKYSSTSYGVGVGTGTDALILSLLACGVGIGDEVITVANAGGYSTSACLHVGAKPVYVDIDESLLMDLISIKRAINGKTKAIIVTHLYGQCIDVDYVKSIVPRNIKIIEDCSQAHGGSFNGRKVGSIGDCGAFSFYPTKNLGSIGDGGMVITNDEQVYKTLLSLRTYGWSDKFTVSIPNGINSRLDEVHAAILSVLLKYLDKNNLKRKKIINKYRSFVPNAQWIGTVENNVHHLCVIFERNRDLLIEHLNGRGIESNIHYPVPDYLQPAWYNDTIRLINTEEASACVVSIPVFPTMTKKQISTICFALKEFYGTKIN